MQPVPGSLTIESHGLPGSLSGTDANGNSVPLTIGQVASDALGVGATSSTLIIDASCYAGARGMDVSAGRIVSPAAQQISAALGANFQVFGNGARTNITPGVSTWQTAQAVVTSNGLISLQPIVWRGFVGGTSFLTGSQLNPIH